MKERKFRSTSFPTSHRVSSNDFSPVSSIHSMVLLFSRSPLSFLFLRLLHLLHIPIILYLQQFRWCSLDMSKSVKSLKPLSASAFHRSPYWTLCLVSSSPQYDQRCVVCEEKTDENHFLARSALSSLNCEWIEEYVCCKCDWIRIWRDWALNRVFDRRHNQWKWKQMVQL